jgi:hypothetical protein
MLETCGAAAQNSEARQRSAGKGKKRAQLPAVERAVWVNKFKESGARSATAHAKDHGLLPERTFREWVKKDAAGGLGTSILPRSRDGTHGKRDRKELYPEVAEKLCQYLNLRATNISRDKCGVDRFIMKEKSLQFAKQICAGDQEMLDGLTASDGRVTRVL